MEMTEREYSALESVLMGAATGHSELAPVSATKRTEGIDSDGHRYYMTQVQESRRVDVSLAKMLLDQRIGGPQDYC